MQKKPYQGQIKIGELESIRGLAALLIIFFHTTATNPLIDIGIINNGYLMVELFFVLSGFIIFNSYANEINSSKELIRFQFLRLGRIYPLHLLFLLIFLTLETIRYILGTKLGMLNSRALPFDKNNLDAFIQHVFLIQAIGPTGNALTFNGPAWSISVEFYTYLIFGVTILLLKHMQTYIFGLIAIITLFMLVADFTYGFNDLLRCLSGFFIGCLTAISIKNIRKTIPSYLSLLTFTSILIFLQLKTTNDFDTLMYFLTAILIVSLILSPNGPLNKFLTLRIFSWLGVISYSMYMSHTFILYGIHIALKYLFQYPQQARGSDGIWLFVLSPTETIVMLSVYLFLVLIASQLTYIYIEKPLRIKSRLFATAKLS